MGIRAVFFDLDDTLVLTTATRADRAKLSAQVLLPHARGLNVEELAARILAPRGDDGFPVGSRPVVEELGIVGTDAARQARDLWFFLGCEHLVRGPEDAGEVVQALGADYQLGVITNGIPHFQANKLDALDFGHHFASHLRVISEAVGYSKPDSRIFRHALDCAGVEPHEAVMVGDWLEADIGGAQNAGLRGVWFNPEGKSRPADIVPDATIRRLDELPAVLHSWD